VIADVSVDELIFAAALACKRNVEQEPIDKAICDAPGADATELDRYAETKFVPFDPIRKRTEATLCGPDGSVFSVSKGSPQVICDLVDDKEMRARVLAVVDEYAARGFRTLGVARTKKGRDDSSWEFLGVLSLYDPPRHDTADTVVNAMALGNEVKMITGDHIAIAKETARQLGLGENIVKPEVFAHHEELGGAFAAQYGDFIENADGFAEVTPEHKSRVTWPQISRPTSHIPIHR
jgi:H+-transporting ATPase